VLVTLEAARCQKLATPQALLEAGAIPGQDTLTQLLLSVERFKAPACFAALTGTSCSVNVP